MRLWIPCALVLIASSFASVQADQVKRLEAWPSAENKERVEKDVERLRKAKTEAMGEQAREALTADGACVIPYLLRPLEKERDESALERILVVMDAVVGAPHTRLLAEQFGHKSIRVRTWALERAGEHRDPGNLAAAEGALAAALKRKAPKKPEDKAAREVELNAAALCATSTGSLNGMERVNELAKEEWGTFGKRIRIALEAVRGEAATKQLLPKLAAGKRRQKVAILRLLAGCGDSSATQHIGSLLDSQDNSIRIEAINALRGIVDGDPPIDRLPVFEAIERVNKWKGRI
jgi:hypothetical protein